MNTVGSEVLSGAFYLVMSDNSKRLKLGAHNIVFGV